MLWGKWTHAIWDPISKESYLFGAGEGAGPFFIYQAVEKLIGFGV